MNSTIFIDILCGIIVQDDASKLIELIQHRVNKGRLILKENAMQPRAQMNCQKINKNYKET